MKHYLYDMDMLFQNIYERVFLNIFKTCHLGNVCLTCLLIIINNLLQSIYSMSLCTDLYSYRNRKPYNCYMNVRVVVIFNNW